MDIQKILQSIHDSGITDAAISRAISKSGHKISQPVIYRLRKGLNKKTSYQRYECIKNFYLSLAEQSKPESERVS